MTEERFGETICLCGAMMDAGEERCLKCEAEMARGLAAMAAHLLADRASLARLRREAS